MMVAVSGVEVAPVMAAPLTDAELVAKVPDVRAGVTVTVMAGKLPPEEIAVVLVQVTAVVVEVPQFQSAPPLTLDCVNPEGSESCTVTVWPLVEPGPLLPTVIV
jgi:hypothetical protein